VSERRLLGIALALGSGAVLLGALAGQLVVSGHSSTVFAFAAVALPFVLWQRPQLTPVVLVLAALTIEQFRYTVGTRNGAATDKIPFFQGLSGGTHVTPADLLLLMLLVFWVLKRGTEGVRPLERTPLNRALLALLGAVFLGVLVGMAHHSQVRVALMEVRPYAYIAITYLLGSVFLTTIAAFRAVLWAFVLGSGFKAGQGVLIYLHARHLDPRPEALLGHEESFFFGIFVFLTLALWLFQIRGTLRTTATFLLPVVLVADLTNGRRTAWLIMFAGLLALVAVGFVCLPQRRRFLQRLVVVLAVFSLLYFPAYWNHNGGLAQPARAVHSFISPDKRDLASNVYRIQEDKNLEYNIRQGKIFGKGFGVPIDYALQIVDISSIDPLIAYIPHNGVLYIFMRMGIVGAVAFWSLIGIGIITACRLARTAEPQVAVFGAVIVAALLAYVLMGYNDQGFFFYRIAFVIGSLLAIADVGLRLGTAETRGSFNWRFPTPAPLAPTELPPEEPAPVVLLPEPQVGPTSGTPATLGRNLSALATGQLITWTMTLLWTLVVPRALGPAGMGLIVTAWSITGILGIVLGLGTRNYLVREMVVDRQAAPRLLGTAIVLRIALAPLFVGAVVLYATFFTHGHEARLVLYLAAGATILTLIAEPMLAGFQAIQRMEYLAYSDVINKSAQGIFGILLVVIGFRAVGITAGWMVVAALVLVLNTVWLAPHLRLELRTSLAALVAMVKNSMAYWAFGLFFMVYLWIDAAMLSAMTRPEVVGWYGVPTKLFQSLMFLPVVVSTAWLPKLVEAFGEGPHRLREAARRPLELVVVLSLPICAATAIVARPLIDVLYGSRYAHSVPVLVILGLCIPPMYLNIMLSQVLVAAKRQATWTWAMAGATVVNPLLNLVLITVTQHRYHNGAIGAALSLLLTELLIVTFGFVLVGREIFERSAFRRSLGAAIAAAAMWGAAYGTSGLGIVLSFGIGLTAFVFVAAIFRVARPEDVAKIRSVISRRLGRQPVPDLP
jgi:O-antigen/teichoic acid export membrane protein